MGYQIDVYCRQSDYVLGKLQINLFSDFERNSQKYITQILENNYDLIFAGKFMLKYPQLQADIFSLHSHSDYYQQKKKFGILFDIFRINRNRVNNEIKNLNNNADALFIFCSNHLKNDYSSVCLIKNSKVVYPYPNWQPIENYKFKKNENFTFGLSALGFQNKGGYLSLLSSCLLKFSGKKFKLKIIYKKKQNLLQKFLVVFLGLRDCVEFLPIQEDMTSFLESIDCLLLPSNIESFGMVGLEAMNFGKPVICSSTCGLAEVINDGKNGWIFKMGMWSVYNLYKKMQESLDFIIYSNVCKEIQDSFDCNDMDSYNETILSQIKKLSVKK